MRYLGDNPFVDYWRGIIDGTFFRKLGGGDLFKELEASDSLRLTEEELSDDSVLEAIEAVDEADGTGDPRPVINLVRTGKLSRRAIMITEDYFERRMQPTGRPRKPSHKMSPAERKLRAGVEEVERRVARGSKKADAIRDVASEKHLSEKTLHGAVRGKHGGLRRNERRL